jgi:hypothetical protein
MFRCFGNKAVLGTLVVVLVIALALTAQEKKRIWPKVGTLSAQPIFDSTRFQSRINGPRGVAGLIDDLSLYGKGRKPVDLAAKPENAKMFLIGSFYSESIAYSRAGKAAPALDRLKVIDKEFIIMGVPNSIYRFIHKIENGITTKKYEPAVLLDFFSLFESVYEDFLKSKGRDQLVLFQAGAWLMDMALAAGAQDIVLLKQRHVLNYFVAEMKRMNAPKDAQDALAEMSTISLKKEISPSDADQVLKLIKRVQSAID